MLIRPYKVSDVRDYFIGMKSTGLNHTVDKTGVKCIELIGASFEADQPAIFGEPNIDYIQKEIKWYQHSGHVITIDKEKEKVFEDVYQFLESLEWTE